MNFLKTKEYIEEVNVSQIVRSPYQPRLTFDDEAIKELSESIRNHGVLQPIVVRKVDKNFEIIAGERRFIASKAAGLEKVPVIVKNYDDKVSAELAIIENIQREDLSAVEEAIAYKQLMDLFGVNQSDLASRLGKSQSSIANKMRLLALPETVKEAILDKEISERHGRALLRLQTDEDRIEFLERIKEKKLNVAKTEEMVNKKINHRPKKKKSKVFANKNVLLAKNTLNQAFDMIDRVGVELNIEENENDEFYTYIVKIKK
jgi:ParB family chromosome partitioning protein